MSLLADFGAGFFGSLGQQMQQQSDLALREALERRRRQYQLEDEERQRRQKREDFVEMENVKAQPRVGYADDGSVALMRDEYGMDEGGKLTRKSTRLGDAPMRPTGKTQTRQSGTDNVTYEEWSDGINVEWREASRGPKFKPSSPQEVRSSGADERLQQSLSRRDRDAFEQAVNNRLTDVRNTLRGASKEVDEDKGVSEYDYALEQLGLPWNTPYTEAINMMRKKYESELAPKYNMGGDAKPDGAKKPPADVLADAKKAIALNPANRAEVLKIMREQGYSTEGL